jgi:hypothetical protein
MARVERLTLDDWMVGNAECLEPRFVFGDQSDFAKLLFERLRAAVSTVSDGWFEKLAQRLKTTRRPSDPDIAVHQLNVLSFFSVLNQVQTLFTAEDSGPFGRNSQNAKSLVAQAIDIANSLYSVRFNLPSEASKPPMPVVNSLPYTAIREAYDQYGSTTGFWITLDLLQQAQAPPTQSTDSRNTGDEPLLLGNFQTTTDKSAIVPVLFIDPQSIGYVLWLEVELFTDYPGPFYPDLAKFGLTDLTSINPNMLEPMAEVWQVSNLGRKYRGRWRITSQYPGQDPDFQKYQQPALHLPNLGGRSVQAAALAALWAASGEIPTAPVTTGSLPGVFSLGGDSLGLNHRVAISAKLNWNSGKSQDDSIGLGNVVGITGKLEAICRYCPSGKIEESLFDTVLILSGDSVDARKKIPLAVEQEKSYRGVHLIEDCNTMADALLWMLEVNAWKFELNQAVTEDWESMWGYARDVNGVFLNRTSGNPILFTSDSAGNNVPNEWSKYFDCPIMVDDDTQKVTLQLKNGSNKAELDKDLVSNQEALRNRLVEIVKTQGINTGSLAYMANPIGGATDEGESDPDSTVSGDSDSDNSDRDGQSVMGGE